MNTIVEFCIIPLGVGVSLSEYIAACEQVLEEAGLTMADVDHVAIPRQHRLRHVSSA